MSKVLRAQPKIFKRIKPKVIYEHYNDKADLSKYIGKYIAIVDNRVVTSGENAKEVWKTAKEKYPDKIPSLAKVPKEELLIL
jgi:hypothetical protein